MGIFAEYSQGTFSCLIFDRFGGVSTGPYGELNFADYVGDDPLHVVQNLAVAQSSMHASDLAVMNAEHGVRVHHVKAGGLCPPADILICQSPNIALLALSADCVTFTIVDTSSGVCLVAHSGWRGLAQDIVKVALHNFVDSGGQLSSSIAVVGPAICGECYQVDAERVGAVSQFVPQAVVDETHLDIAAGVQAQLQNVVSQVIRYSECNFENESLFSYRRAAGSSTGRGGMAVMLSEAGA